MNIKKVKLIDSDKYTDVIIDFEKMLLIRATDNLAAKIFKIVKNILYLDPDNLKEQKVIVFDDKFAVFGITNKRILYYHQPMNIWIAPKFKAIYYEVAKNACTSIASSFYNKNWKTFFSPKITKNRSVWDCLFWKNHSLKLKYLFINPIYRKDIDKYKDYTKFLVYDDPIDRFLRALNNKYINHPTIASIVKPPYSENIHDFIDLCILTTQLTCLNHYQWDQHLVPIMQSAAMYINDVEDFVYLKDISTYMKKKFNLSVGRHNAMPKEKKPIHREMLLPYQIERIKEIYKKDYEIPTIYKNKFYVPN